MSNKVLSYDSVSDVCQSIANLSQSISGVCSRMAGDHPGNGPLSHQLTLLENAADTIGLMADHIIDGDMRGGAQQWFDLPPMKEAEGEL